MSATKEINHNEIGKGITTADAGKNDYPMLFDTQMVKAILSGEKTQTTRAFKSPLSKFVEPAKEIFFENDDWVARFEKPSVNVSPNHLSLWKSRGFIVGERNMGTGHR